MTVDALLQHVQVLNVHPCIALIYVGNTATLCALSCSTLSEKRCMHRLWHYLGERPEGRTGLRVALACVR